MPVGVHIVVLIAEVTVLSGIVVGLKVVPDSVEPSIVVAGIVVVIVITVGVGI